MKKMLLLGMVFALVLVAGVAYAGEPIKLGMSTWLGYAPLYLAKEKGFFQKRGLEVEIVVIESPSDRRAAFAADRIQGFATTVDTHVMTAAAENPIPVKQVLALDDSNGGDGLKLSDIQAVDMKAGDAGAAFVAGKIDAAVTWEPWLSRAKDTPFGKILIASDQTPGIIVDSLGFKPDYLKRRGDDVKKIIAAWNEAVQFAAQNPKEADAIMAKFTNQKPEEFTAEKSGVRFYGEKENKEYFGTPQKPGLLYQVTQRAADTWFDLKFIKNKPNAADLIDGSYF
jgi:NitT/TauT family transport system substrate-binding protein